MMLLRGSFTGPLKVLTLCNHTIKWVNYARLLDVTIDNKLTWSQHIFEVKKNFVNKLNLLKRSPFLPRNVLLDVYFKIICILYNLYLCILCVADMGKSYQQGWVPCPGITTL